VSLRLRDLTAAVAALESRHNVEWGGTGHVGVDAEQLWSGLFAHGLGDRRTPVAALRNELVVTETLHEHDPGTRGAGGIPPGRRRLAGEPVARERRDHRMEGILRASAMRSGIGERLDDLHLLDDRAGPSVRHDQRQRILVLGSNMNEMDVEPVDRCRCLCGESSNRLTSAVSPCT
jgi:hypothetical protein